MHRSALLAVALFALAATAAPAQEPGQPPISERTKRSGGPLSPPRAAARLAHASLAIEVLPDRRMLSGLAQLRIAVVAPTSTLELDLDTNLPVSAVSLDGAPLAHSQWRHADGALTLQLPRAVVPGTTLLIGVTYAGTPHVAVRAPWDDGLVWSRAGDAHWAGTTAQGYGCDLFWPCLDFPQGEPAAVDLHVTVPAGLKAPANGVLLGVDDLPDGRTTWHWRSGAINPYDVALSIGPYAELTGSYRSRFGNTIALHYWHLPKNAAKAPTLFAEFAPTLDFFESRIGPFPFGHEKLGLVETPYLGMEHQTINAYGNGYKPAPEGFDWLFQHELSHEWFGNQLTAADWDDFWLHEGFGNYMQPLYGEWREGEARYATMMQAQRVRILNKAPIVSGRSRTSEEVYENGAGGPGTDIYYKGAWVLHSLRTLIGDRAFFAATRRLVYGRADPRPGNFAPRFGTTAEFIRLAEEESGRKLDWFFDVYLRRAALPDLVERRTGDTLSLRWKAPDDLPFPMPVEIEVDGERRKLPMPDGHASLTVPASAHVVLDPRARVLRRSPALERVQAAAAQPQE